MLLTVHSSWLPMAVRKENSPSKGGCGFQQRSEFPILFNTYDPPSYQAENLPRKNGQVTVMTTLRNSSANISACIFEVA